MNRLRDRIHSLLVPSGDGALVSEAPPVPVREIFRRFWPDARPYRRWIPVGLLLIALGAAIETAEIWMFKLVVDEVLVPGELEPLVWIVALYIGFTIAGGLITFADDYLATWLGERFLQRMRRRLFSHVQKLSLDVLDRRRLGDVIARLTGDVQAIESFVPLRAAADRLLHRRADLPGLAPRARGDRGRAALPLRGAPLLAAHQARLAREAAPQRVARRGR